MPSSPRSFEPCRAATSSLIAPIAVNSWRFYAATEIEPFLMSRYARDFVDSRDLVLVAIPCFNEEEHIANVIETLLAGADDIRMRIVVADGGSTDRTREIVEQLAKGDDRVLLLDNPRKIQSVAVNEVVRHHGEDARFLIRVDAHAEYPQRYCEHLACGAGRNGCGFGGRLHAHEGTKLFSACRGSRAELDFGQWRLFASKYHTRPMGRSRASRLDDARGLQGGRGL